METALDKFGRIVLPKKLRKALLLSAGDKLEVEVADGNVILKPARCKARLVRKNGLLVIEGGPRITVEDVNRIIQEERDERDRRNLGLP